MRLFGPTKDASLGFEYEDSEEFVPWFVCDQPVRCQPAESTAGPVNSHSAIAPTTSGTGSARWRFVEPDAAHWDGEKWRVDGQWGLHKLDFRVFLEASAGMGRRA